MTAMQANPMIQKALSQLGGQVGNNMTENWLFFYAADFSAIAQNAEQAKSIQINAGTDFLCLGWLLDAVLNSASTPTNCPAGMKLQRRVETPFVTGGNSTVPYLHHVTMQFRTMNRQYTNVPIRADLCCADAGELVLLPSSLYVPANDVVTVTLKNNLPALTGVAAPSIDAQFAMIGVNMQR